MASFNDYQPSPETDDEMLPVVDWDDRQTGLATRRDIHAQGLLHRAVHVVLTDGCGSLLLQKRSSRKDAYPGWWDISVGGHVSPGEAYAEAAVREIAEEMGVRGTTPQLAAILPPQLVSGWEHVHVFACAIDPACVVPDPAEVDDHRWVSCEELLANASPEASSIEWRLTPSALRSIRAWLDVGAPGLRTN
ncbi:MAG: rRNA (adenine1518-N6/adenine1519-N6)-dimethyltransferase [Candidatus Sumerlaeota bacterium]|nr:rRNA (adenine1518-N6/adenine1519-N6)-dimethyltransferase [Candidatus Sumerlaeota bacterium]